MKNMEPVPPMKAPAPLQNSILPRPPSTCLDSLKNRRVAFVGKLASMANAMPLSWVRQHGANCLGQARRLGRPVVLGEEELLLPGLGDRMTCLTRRRGGESSRGPSKSSPRRNFGSNWGPSSLMRIFTGSTRRRCWPILLPGARGGDSPLASAWIDRAGARGAAAAVFRFFRRWPRRVGWPK